MVDDLDPLTAPEADAPALLRLAVAYQPQATDGDRTQAVSGIALDLSGLPAGTRFSTGGRTHFTAASGSGLQTRLTTAEGDIKLSGTCAVTLFENDAIGNNDKHATTSTPVQFNPAAALTATSADLDGSESIADTAARTASSGVSVRLSIRSETVISPPNKTITRQGISPAGRLARD